MKPILAVLGLANSWFGHFRWREFAAAMAAVYAGILELCNKFSIPEEKSAKLAVIITSVCAVLYWLNPKSLDWAIPKTDVARRDDQSEEV